jgi:hypothetical protein
MIGRRRVNDDTSAQPWPARRDEYLTDGRRLLRVIDPLDLQAGIETAVIEDCETLAWRTFTFPELWWLRLRIVSPQRPSMSSR